MNIRSAEWFRKDHNSGAHFGIRIRRFLKIFKSASDCRLMLSITTWALILPVLKRVVPLKFIARRMWSPPRKERTSDQEQKVATIVRWIYTFVFPKDACIERSLILYRFLSKISVEPKLVTGLRRIGDQSWKGHAWIIVDGKPFEEPQSSVADFQTVAVFGPAGKSSFV